MNESLQGINILVVDDRREIGKLIEKYLSREGCRVDSCLSGEKLFEYLDNNTPDLIILDRMLPGMNGFEICQRLRDSERFEMLPIIMLSGKGDTIDKVSGLNVGADDYLAKPFELEELRARVIALLRRHGDLSKEEKLKIRDIIVINIQKRMVMVNNKKINLTFAEFKILELLAIRKGQVLSRDKILHYLWGDDKIVVERTVDFHIKNLRDKLGDEGKVIKNIRGFGYVLDEEDN